MGREVHVMKGMPPNSAEASSECQLMERMSRGKDGAVSSGLGGRGMVMRDFLVADVGSRCKLWS